MTAGQRVTVLGSTGSIGRQTLDVVDGTGDRFSVHALAANTDVESISAQIERMRPARVAMTDPGAAEALRGRFPELDVLDGPSGLLELAADPSAGIVLNAVVGSAGLEATLAALDAGSTVALANKESCVAGGPLVSRRLRAGAKLVPVDSEHASAHMCLRGEPLGDVTRLVLTASGGPFRGRTADDLADVTVEDALRHPTWAMGPKITIDSATLANKGLEVLEAHVLFDLSFDAIDVVCHPGSVIHCLVAFADGSWKASLSPPDMRVPIAYALGYPARPDWGASDVDWATMPPLSFEPVDTGTFRLLPLAYEAGRAGGTAPAVLNAANEVAVAAFLDRRTGFLRIADLVERVVAEGQDADLGYGRDDLELDDVRRADGWARARTGALLSE